MMTGGLLEWLVYHAETNKIIVKHLAHGNQYLMMTVGLIGSIIVVKGKRLFLSIHYMIINI